MRIPTRPDVKTQEIYKKCVRTHMQCQVANTGVPSPPVDALVAQKLARFDSMLSKQLRLIVLGGSGDNAVMVRLSRAVCDVLTSMN